LDITEEMNRELNKRRKDISMVVVAEHLGISKQAIGRGRIGLPRKM